MNPSRRGFLLGLGSTIIAAPAIVRAASLMKIRALDEFEFSGFESTILLGQFGDLASIMLKAYRPRLIIQTYQTSPLLAALQNG